jgi:lipopolysaccharide export system permease protein
VWIAVVIFFVYYNLAATGRTWIARGSVPEVVGLWWTHVVVAVLALLVILGPGVANRLRYRLRGL